MIQFVWSIFGIILSMVSTVIFLALIFVSYFIYKFGIRGAKKSLFQSQETEIVDAEISGLKHSYEEKTKRVGIRKKVTIPIFKPEIRYTFEYNGDEFTSDNWFPDNINFISKNEKLVLGVLRRMDNREKIRIRIPDENPTEAYIFGYSSYYSSVGGRGGGILSKLLSGIVFVGAISFLFLAMFIISTFI